MKTYLEIKVPMFLSHSMLFGSVNPERHWSIFLSTGKLGTTISQWYILIRQRIYPMLMLLCTNIWIMLILFLLHSISIFYDYNSKMSSPIGGIHFNYYILIFWYDTLVPHWAQQVPYRFNAYTVFGRKLY